MMVMKLEVFSLTFQKHLIKSSTMVFYSNCNFLTNRKQKVVLNGQSFSWTNVKARVLQGFLKEFLGPFDPLLMFQEELVQY